MTTGETELDPAPRPPRWSLWIGLSTASAVFGFGLIYDALVRFPSGLVSRDTYSGIVLGLTALHLLLLLPAFLAPVLAIKFPKTVTFILRVFSLVLVADIIWQVLLLLLVRDGIHQGARTTMDVLFSYWTAFQVLELIWAAMACVVLAKLHQRPLSETLAPQALVLIASLIGTLLGVEAWSRHLPPRIVAAAEAIAGDEPHCMATGADLATSTDRFQGRALVRAAGWSYYATLLIPGEQNDRYFNWSFKRGGFVPIRPESFKDRAYPMIGSCPSPQPHFALTLK